MTSQDAPDARDAKAIADAVLEGTRAGYLNGDFDLFESFFRYPLRIGSFEGERTIRTRDELRSVFDAMREMMQTMGVIDLHRRTVEAEFVADDRINSTFVAEYILQGYRVSDEVVGNATLVRNDGAWKVIDSVYATKMSVVSRTLILK